MVEKKWTEAKAIRPLFLRSPPIKGPLPNQEGQNKIEIQGVDGGKGCGAHREKLEKVEKLGLSFIFGACTSLSLMGRFSPFPCFFSNFNLYTGHSQALINGSGCY